MNLRHTTLLITAVAIALAVAPVALAGGPTPAELKALEIRGQAMSHLCDANHGISAQGFAALCGSLAAGQVTQVVRSSGFDWSDFGIGAGAMLGFVLLAGGIAAGVHFGRRGSVHPRPIS